jgi:hypothetical protein
MAARAGLLNSRPAAAKSVPTQQPYNPDRSVTAELFAG